jgi:hypothetical protein
MNRSALLRLGVALLFSLALAPAGELRRSYFEATKPGAWSEYGLTSGTRPKATFRYQRQRDLDGKIVIELTVTALIEPGKNSKSKNTYIMSRNFNLGRDGLSFGKFIEKMSMSSSGMDMHVDDTTLDQIRQAERDFRGAVTFEKTEKIDGRTCDRYTYSLRTLGPVPTIEKGTIWLSHSVPFAIVRQVADVFRPNGSKLSSFAMQLQNTGTGAPSGTRTTLPSSLYTPAKAPPKNSCGSAGARGRC